MRKWSMFLRNLPRFCRSVSTATSQRQGQGMAHAGELVGPSVFLTSLVVMSAPNSALNRSCSSAGLHNTHVSPTRFSIRRSSCDIPPSDNLLDHRAKHGLCSRALLICQRLAPQQTEAVASEP